MKEHYEKLFESCLRKVNLAGMSGRACAMVKPPKDVDIREFSKFLAEEGLVALLATDKERGEILIIPTFQAELVWEKERNMK